jgi:L-threonylcarbamoyladenylate synthase
MSKFMTELLSATPDGITRAVALLRDGQLVGLPTETVYGLAGDARNNMACARIFEAKGRPNFNPLIVHVLDLADVAKVAEISDPAAALASAFWPGPMTLVLPLKPGHGLSPLVSAGLDTVAIRIPRHPLARQVLAQFGGALAAPSANPSGRISPTDARHVLAGLGGKIAAVLDGGSSEVGMESTILAPMAGSVVLLREGGIPREAIERLTGPLSVGTTPGKLTAPGQMNSHYAPHTKVQMNKDLTNPHCVRIGFGPGSVTPEFTLSQSGDLIEAAANLFRVLHEADAFAQTNARLEIHIAPVPEKGLGRAINDRLRRASATTDQA